MYRDTDLTVVQQDLLLDALHEGYFEVPRETTLVDLADKQNITDIEASASIRDGLTKVLQDRFLSTTKPE